ncbi:MAG TPA: hypothetical protein VN688_08495 [Gemmataceae bacterium]|nr:hypothetical protein [Gemmataceae bacterium]
MFGLSHQEGLGGARKCGVTFSQRLDPPSLGGAVICHALVQFAQWVLDDSAIVEVVDELNPGMRGVGLTGNVAEGQSESMAGGRVKLDLARNVPKAGRVQ